MKIEPYKYIYIKNNSEIVDFCWILTVYYSNNL